MSEPIRFFDGHNDLLLRLFKAPEAREAIWLGKTGEGHLDLARMQASGFAGGLFAIFVPPQHNGDAASFLSAMEDPPYEIPLPPLMTHSEAQADALAIAGHLHWMARASDGAFHLCRSAAEIRHVVESGGIAGVMHMEGAEAIGPDLDALYLFYEMGLRSLGPVWSRDTIFGHGVPMAFPGSPDTGPGLTEHGKDLVRLCDRLGILIDLSHMNEKGFDDVAAISEAPLVATHSNAHALCPTTRNLTDRQLHIIRERDGLVGLNYATSYLNPDGTGAASTPWEVLLRQLDYLMNAVGEDRVALGSDFDGCTLPDVIGDVTGMPKFFDMMALHGYDAGLINKLARENWLACLDRCLKTP